MQQKSFTIFHDRIGACQHEVYKPQKNLSDAAKTCASRAMAMAAAGQTVEDLEKFIHDTVSTHIRVAKDQIAHTLDSIKKKAAKNQDLVGE